MKKRSLLFIIFLSFLISGFLALRKNAGYFFQEFSVSDIYYKDTGFVPKDYQLTYSEDQIQSVKEILNQKFSYLGSGNQSHAFLSHDSKYVLKFFKFRHLQPNYWAKVQDIEAKLKFYKVFDGYHVAYTEDPESSALLFVHLNDTDHLPFKVEISDQWGLKHTIDLNDVPFVIQEKVTPTKEVLTKLFKKGDIEGVKKKIDALFSLYIVQYQKGLYDRDHNLMYNTGFKEDKAIRFDVGKFRKEPLMKDKEHCKKDLEKIAFIRINRFVKSYFSKYENEIRLAMEEKLALIFQEMRNN